MIRPIRGLDAEVGDVILLYDDRAALYRDLNLSAARAAVEGPEWVAPLPDSGTPTLPDQGSWENEGDEWKGREPPQVAPAPRPSNHRLAVDAENRATAGQREREAEKYPTLDLWLEAEARGKIRAPAPKSGTTARVLISREHGMAALTVFLKAREARIRRRVRVCKVCGGEFTGSMAETDTIRCPKCGGRRTKGSK